MARIVHDTAAILDAAGGLLRYGTPADITMAGVIREAGVSSGSVYHRFPDRATLLASLWNRTVERYHAGGYALFEGDAISAAASLARYTVEWCATNPMEARVLLAGVRQFDPDDWPERLTRARELEQIRWDEQVRHLVRDLRRATGRGVPELLVLVVDLPYAAVRRNLLLASAVPSNLGVLVANVIRSALIEDER